MKKPKIILSINFFTNTNFTIMAIRNYPCPKYRKRLKLTYRLKRHINMCTNHHIISIDIYLKQNTPIQGEDGYILENVGPYEDRK